MMFMNGLMIGAVALGLLVAACDDDTADGETGPGGGGAGSSVWTTYCARRSELNCPADSHTIEQCVSWHETFLAEGMEKCPTETAAFAACWVETPVECHPDGQVAGDLTSCSALDDAVAVCMDG